MYVPYCTRVTDRDPSSSPRSMTRTNGRRAVPGRSRRRDGGTARDASAREGDGRGRASERASRRRRRDRTIEGASSEEEEEDAPGSPGLID